MFYLLPTDAYLIAYFDSSLSCANANFCNVPVPTNDNLLLSNDNLLLFLSLDEKHI